MSAKERSAFARCAVKYETVSFLGAQQSFLAWVQPNEDATDYRSSSLYSRDLRDRSKVLSFSELVRTKRAARLRSPSTQIGAARPGPPYCAALLGCQHKPRSRQRLARAPHNGACARHPEPAATRSAESCDEPGSSVGNGRLHGRLCQPGSLRASAVPDSGAAS